MQPIVNRSQVNLKKTAFRTKIRKEWLDNYFQQKRTELLQLNRQHSQKQEQLNIKFSEIFQHLPEQKYVDMLVVAYEENRQHLVKYLRLNLSKLIDTIREINLKTFTLYLLLLSNVCVCYPEARDEVLHMSLRRMVGQGKRLMRETKMMGHMIVFNLIEFILILSERFSQMDQILVSQVTGILCQSLAYIEIGMQQADFQQNYVRTLQIINQFLSASVNGIDQEEQQENIDQNDQRDLEYLKAIFIHKMFNQNSSTIRTIIKTVSVLSTNERVVLITLKVFTNLTYYTADRQVYYNLFNCNVQHLVFTTLKNFPKKQPVIVILVRLINNLVLFSKETAQYNIENMSLKLLVSIFNKQKYGRITLVEEICEMFSRLIYFMEQNKHTIQYLINKQAIEVLIYGLQHIQKTSNILEIIYAFPFLLKAQRITVAAKIRQNQQIFRKIADQGEQDASQMVKHLLQQAFNQNYEPLQNSESQQRDVEI